MLVMVPQASATLHRCYHQETEPPSVPQRPFVVPSSPAADCLLVWSRGYRAGSSEAAGPKAQMRQSSEPDSGPPERAAPFLL
ncbi:hypothetical protein CAOG_02717 [Capsaspora owczarzaki ATCC 30864]|uniref:hypothetical protein n=1 Tax=Capsaspora owczarzaki (strain ATCC 30864) TaxID=595528 RepID=UPI0001FE4032|nr:hypothetical protein CAOG_02717 [Capsaspora owczarzaki ATCC 30864]|eukprot:XP_004349467.1 hypothetical protein CAOG_02717 [Capsaspora owczarzaki ATCC 30864]